MAVAVCYFILPIEKSDTVCYNNTIRNNICEVKRDKQKKDIVCYETQNCGIV